LFKLSENCCDKTDVKKFSPHKKGGKSLTKKNSNLEKIFGLENPIPDELKDSELTQQFFKTSPYIPFSGSDKFTSQCLVDRLQDMRYKSQTKGAVMKSINTYSFNGRIKMVNSIDNEFDLGVDSSELVGADQKIYLEYLKGINLFGSTYKDLAKCLSNSWQTTGNEWLELILDEEYGNRFFGISYVNPSYICYKRTEAGEERWAGISNSWNFENTQKNPPRDVPIYPNAASFPDGTVRTILHKKDGHFNWYGRPNDMAAFVPQWNEAGIYDYLTKAIDTMFIGQIALEYEADGRSGGLLDDEDARAKGYSSSLDRIEQHLTVAGERPTSMLIMKRPKGAKPFTLEQIEMMTKEGFVREIKEEIRNDIVMLSGWSSALLTMDHSSGFNSQMFKDIFSVLSCTTVLEHQEAVGDIINTALQIGAEWVGNEVAFNSSIQFMSPVQKLIDQKVEEEGRTKIKVEEIE